MSVHLSDVFPMTDQQEKQVKYDPSQSGDSCPHARAARDAAKDATATPVKAAGTFDYQKFYETELDKKHKDR